MLSFRDFAFKLRERRLEHIRTVGLARQRVKVVLSGRPPDRLDVGAVTG